MKNLKTAFITGATSGFGEACAKTFAENGWNLVITGRRNDRLTSLKEELEMQFGNEVTTLCFDVRNQKEVNDAIDKLKEKLHHYEN